MKRRAVFPRRVPAVETALCAAALAAGFLACLLWSAAAKGADPTRRIADALDLEWKGTPKAVQTLDSHGGFHGDGLTYVELELDAESCEALKAAAKRGDGWRTPPLSETAETVFYGTERLENGVLLSRSAATPEGVRIPKVQSGCWRLIDRQAGAPEQIFDESRRSVNFTAALVDFDRLRLYFLEIDS